jgi:hypothetical protein
MRISSRPYYLPSSSDCRSIAPQERPPAPPYPSLFQSLSLLLPDFRQRIHGIYRGSASPRSAVKAALDAARRRMRGSCGMAWNCQGDESGWRSRGRRVEGRRRGIGRLVGRTGAIVIWIMRCDGSYFLPFPRVDCASWKISSARRNMVSQC